MLPSYSPNILTKLIEFKNSEDLIPTKENLGLIFDGSKLTYQEIEHILFDGSKNQI